MKHTETYELVPFTGIVVVCNEEDRLGACLSSLRFCDELLVVDLESEDASSEIAREYGARVLPHERIPAPGAAREYGARHASNDWIVYLDPDEVFPGSLHPKMSQAVVQNSRVGRLFIPLKFYFKGEALEGTRWGGRKHKGHVVHRHRCSINKHVHREVSLLEGYEARYIPWDHGLFIEHYWMDSYSGLIEKHLRYVKREGAARYEEGNRFPGWRLWVKQVIRAFKRSYIDESGWQEGGRGLFLSLFWAWYEGASLLSLLNEENQRQ